MPGFRKQGEIRKPTKEEEEQRKKDVLRYIELVKIVRKSKSKKQSDHAYNEIFRMMKQKVEQISYSFKIPGMKYDDILQESLFALRFKAIKDYDPKRSNYEAISPFDKFAILCIRRHLSTKLKSSYQNKSVVLNQACRLDQDRNKSSISDDVLVLADILPHTKKDILTQLNDKEYSKILFSKLFEQLSQFEKEVFVLYSQKYSYEEIIRKLNKKKEYKEKREKAIDNARSRIVAKAKEVYVKYG